MKKINWVLVPKQNYNHRVPQNEILWVSFNPNGNRIFLNKSAYKAIGKPRHVELVIGDDGRYLGVRGATCFSSNAYKIYLTSKNTGGSIASVPLFKVIGNQYYGQYHAYIQDGLLVIDLSTGEMAETDDD